MIEWEDIFATEFARLMPLLPSLTNLFLFASLAFWDGQVLQRVAYRQEFGVLLGVSGKVYDGSRECCIGKGPTAPVESEQELS